MTVINDKQMEFIKSVWKEITYIKVRSKNELDVYIIEKQKIRPCQTRKS